MSSFSVGDMAVYQGQGVGQITEISTMEVAGQELEFYTLEMGSGALLRVPTHRAQELGLRWVIEMAQIPVIYEVLCAPADPPKEKAWNRRFRIYNDKLRSGDLAGIAEVLRDLNFLSKNKELSYGERQMMEQAQSLLVAEIALASEKSHLEISEELEQLLS